MRFTYYTPNKRMSIEFEADSHTAIWQEVAAFSEVFEEPCCGKCKSENLRFVIRKATDEKKKKEYNYHELRCLDCHAKLAFGVMEDGKLFPKRKEDGEWKGSNGWVKWNKEKGIEE
jgi:hypothetical protein